MDKWDDRFLHLSQVVATWSKDPSTQVGAVIVRPNNTICSTGYNGFPRGLKDDKELYENRATKVVRTMHAEINAIITAPESLVGYTMYTTLPPCNNCGLAIIQSGIDRLISFKPAADLYERWNLEASLALLEEGGVTWELT